MKIFTTALIFISAALVCGQTKFNEPPQWAKEAVWYQIFPERFNNGDKSNDPKPEDMEGAWPYFTPEGWQIHPWTSDWYKLQPWEKKTGFDFYRNAGLRRYGGDIRGIIDKLDYLKELGITAIYLNPVFESPSLHKYDASMYHHIDNNFGPDPEGDKAIWEKENPADPSTWQWTSADKLFLELIKEAHKRGIKIIIDGVFNHTGNNFWAFKDIVKNQQNSRYKDWYTIKKWDDPNTPENEFDYEGWYGVKDLPEIKEDENGIVEGPAEHIHLIVKRWMDPNGDGNPEDGIDGWRLDVAEMVNHKFWMKFRKWVREINPDAYLVGEVWWKDWNNYEMFNAAPWLQTQFDAVMNYRFTRAIKDLVFSEKYFTGVRGFIDTIKTMMNQYGVNYYAMMNLMGSHDTERHASLIVNPDNMYDHSGNPGQNPGFDVRKPNEIEREKQKLAVALQFTLPGAPQIYYGDEAGMWGGDDPDCRKPMVWEEFNYEVEKSHPLGKDRPADSVFFDKQLFDWYKKMARIRNGNKALSVGKVIFMEELETQNILAYKRILDGEEIIVIANIKGEPEKFDINKAGTMRDLVSGNKINCSEKISLNGYQIMILQ
ncbi:cyclomaltodextrinase [Melioribacter roseus P3M-2]|uniref:Cyclomaltodextrinase n=1 Tax=Melioribacter roseus (strain DSM 23840 / JCM 17771 / VKM B-2668 / P3M-2) TaxID=1191523 RepID=I6ZPP7_MELRP|nr:glycoside hydrolase family 13 protein [Melioribacter roseus]AFN74004.1 cyclomaltodextrinase [Melioribacter roseus P3M-2]